MPGISTGILGYPKTDGCRAIVEEVVRHLQGEPGSVRPARLVSIDEETAHHVLAVAAALW